jgi:hypothetical protein
LRRSLREVRRVVSFAPSPVRQIVERIYGDQKAPIDALSFLASLEDATADIALD